MNANEYAFFLDLVPSRIRRDLHQRLLHEPKKMEHQYRVDEPTAQAWMKGTHIPYPPSGKQYITYI